MIYEHSPREADPDCTVVWLLLKAHSGAKRVAPLWQKFFRNEAFMRAEYNAEAMQLNANHKAVNLNDIDDAGKYVHGDDFIVESMEEHKVDIEGLTINGAGQVDITWARLEQSRTAALTPSTAAATKTTRNTSNELFWKRAKARSLASDAAIYLTKKAKIVKRVLSWRPILNMLDTAYIICRADRDFSKPRARTEARLKRIAEGVCWERFFTTRWRRSR